MTIPALTQSSARPLRTAFALCLAAVLLFACVSFAGAQQKDKKKKKDAPAGETAATIPTNDEARIDYLISEMLGAWQIGDTDKLHKTYADDVSVVNGFWAPPVFGWTNYLASYQQQRLHIQQVRMDRSNTFIKVEGPVAWACYQWDFAATVDGRPLEARGQTTLILEKRNNNWLIVHNHTSVAQAPQAPPANASANPQPQTPTPTPH